MDAVQFRKSKESVPGDLRERLVTMDKVQDTQNDERLSESSDDEWNEIIKAETPFYYVDSPLVIASECASRNALK